MSSKLSGSYWNFRPTSWNNSWTVVEAGSDSVLLVPVEAVVVRSWIMHSALPSSSTHTIPWRHITQKDLSTVPQKLSRSEHHLMDGHNKKRWCLRPIISCCSSLSWNFSLKECSTLQIYYKTEFSIVFSNISTNSKIFFQHWTSHQ